MAWISHTEASHMKLSTLIMPICTKDHYDSLGLEIVRSFLNPFDNRARSPL